MQAIISTANASKRPADGLFDEVALVGGRALDALQRVEEWCVGRGLVMERYRSDERERGAPDELFAARAPFPEFLPGVRRLVEEMETGGVAVRPVLEAPCPPIHLIGSDFRRVFNEGGKQSRLEPSGSPECEGQRMVVPVRLGHLSDDPYRDTEDFRGGNAVPRHAVAITCRSLPLERAKQRIDELFRFGRSPSGHGSAE